MSLQITSDNIEISASMTALAREKVSKLISHLSDMPADAYSARAILNSGPDNTFEAKLQLFVGNKAYVGSKRGYTLESAIVLVVSDVQREYLKDKRRDRYRGWKLRRLAKWFRFGGDEG